MQRFTATIKYVDTVDLERRVRCMLALARYTGRRESAICHLRISDLLLTPEGIAGAIAAQGMDERQADHMPHGAIRWGDEHDKQGYSTIAPISQPARKAVDAYLQTSPRVGDAWAFPSPKDDSKPIRRDLASRWLIKAEKLAGLPKLTGGVWHPYRRAWATDRKHLPDADVAAAGGWRDTSALNDSYQLADPATTLRVVEEGA